jgi:hypothetical protein
MRAISALAVAALVTLDVGAAAAQSTRHFNDSWFWGAKAGVLAYQVQSAVNPPSNNIGNEFALLGGVDWLITRKKGGLYVAFDYSFVTGDSVFVNDSITPLDTVPRSVHLEGMRRFTLAGMLFPLESQRYHPYFGLGMSLSSIAEVEPQGTFSGPIQETLVLNTVTQFKTAATPIVILGLQMRLIGFSIFGQATATPANNHFFLWTQNGWRTSGEVGIRYNIGSSIDRMR